MKKILLCVILVVTGMFLTTASVMATTDDVSENATEIVQSGSCGDSASWTLDAEGKLVIQGTGSIRYEFGADSNLASKIKSVVIENGITEIGCRAFADCRGITGIVLPNGVTSIGESAFYRCKKLTDVTLPESLTSIGIWAFFGCETLANVYIPDMESWLGIDFGNTSSNPTYYADNLYVNGSLLTDLKIPENVTSIGNYAFYGYSRLTGATIPKSVTSIGDDAFGNLSRKTSIILECDPPDTATTAFRSFDGTIYYPCGNILWDETEQQRWNTPAIWEKSHQLTEKATTTNNGTIQKSCQVCGEKLPLTIIPKVASIRLSSTAYSYTGTVKTPAVTVKDKNGKLLTNRTDYTVSYAAGRKSVGTYQVTVTLKGTYSGSKTFSFTIRPKGTSISKLNRSGKAFTVKWKKQNIQTSGYQILYSTNRKFKSGNKYVTIRNNQTTTKRISKRKAKKKYYVKVRTYKRVKGAKYYSDWSSVKTVTTK